MSSLPCGLEPVNSHRPCWMPSVSLEPPPWKMSSVLELTLSVKKLPASAALVEPWTKLPLPLGDPASAKTWSQSWEEVVEPEGGAEDARGGVAVELERAEEDAGSHAILEPFQLKPVALLGEWASRPFPSVLRGCVLDGE